MGNPIVIHIRRLADFELGYEDWLGEQISEAKRLFWMRAGLDLQVGSDKPLLFNLGVVKDVTQCLMGGAGGQDRQELFERVTDVPANEIIVFTVLDFETWKGGGCAWHPLGILGCMVRVGTLGKHKWKLAHEVAHVLGLFHTEESNTRLMWPSVGWRADPPFFSEAESDFLTGNGSAPIPRPEESLGVTERGVEWELEKIEPDYQKLVKRSAKVTPLLRRYYERTADYEFKARAVYALSLVSREIDDILASAAASPSAEVRRAAASAAGRLRALARASRLLLQLIHDPDPSVRYVAAQYVPLPAREAADATTRRGASTSRSEPVETLCQQGGPEITATAVTLGFGDTATFDYYMCESTARVQVYLVLHEVQRQLLADEQGKNKLSLMLPKLPPGRHLLYWGFQQVGFEWQTRAELLVNSVCRFRHRKSHNSADPVNRGFLVLEVVAAQKKKGARKRKSVSRSQ
jgi:hypothetical protein